MEEIKNILRSVNQLQGRLVIVHLSTEILCSESALTSFAENLSILSEAGARFIIVHDYRIEDFVEELNLSQYLSASEMESSTSPLMHEMILSSVINKNIVRHLNSQGVKAIGISAKDGPIVLTERARILKAADNNQIKPHKPAMVFPELLFEFEETNITPVISPVSYSENGISTIVESYQMASMLGVNLAADHIVLFHHENNFEELSKTILLEAGLQKLKLSDKNLLQAIKFGLGNSEMKIHLPATHSPEPLLLSLLARN